MICLAAFPGIWASGCFWSQALPPTHSIGRAPGFSPRYRIPHQSKRAMPQLPARPRQQAGNPWKPSAPGRQWNHIVVHHTASNSGSVESIHEAHLRRKDGAGNPWLGIGYHFVIGNGNGMGDGEIEPTFRWNEQMHGAHAGVREYNQHGIGIALVGNFDHEPPSAAQMAAVKRLVRHLTTSYAISRDRIVGHGDVKATNCPGKYFPLEELKQSLSRGSLSRIEPASSSVSLTGSF